jgi:D-glycero-alpha-D-manno-heptose-7-phosphate kinase
LNSLLQSLVVRDTDTVLTAIKIIESSRLQSVFVMNRDNVLVGIATNGDVRRYLLHGGEVGSTVTDCMNKDFRFVKTGTSREELLKLFDLGFSVIPKIDEDGCLIDLMTQEYVLTAPESPVLSRARAPVRISFGGGGSDLTYYFVDNPGLVLSTTVALFCHVTLVPRADQRITIHSEDLGTANHYASLNDLTENLAQDLLTSVISVIKPVYGFDLYVRSDFPVGSGLGGSSAVATAIVAAFNEFRLDHWTTYEIAELAFHAERLCFGVAGGWQDQYASAFGGFNLIELDGKKNFVHAIRMESSTLNELEECLILCDSGIEHDSGDLHKKQREAVKQADNMQLISTMVDVCREMHKHLIRGELMEFGRCLDKSWRLKRTVSSSISNNKIDEIYRAAIDAGAIGGKLLGAGAGGFFLFFVQPQFRQAVVQTLRKMNCKPSNFRFETEGVTSWLTKVL